MVALAAVGAAGFAGMLVSGSAQAAASAAPATVVSPVNGVPITGGGSRDPWALKLPSGAHCSGDSATKGFFVYTYFAAADADPGSLTFSPSVGARGPAGTFVWPLIDVAGSPFISRNTAPTSGELLPGTRFNWARFSIDGKTGINEGDTGIKTAPGSYNVGVACWNAVSRTLDRYWKAPVTFVASSTDPSGLVWRAAPTTNAVSGTSNKRGMQRNIAWVALVAGAAMASVSGVLIWRARRRRPLPQTVTPSTSDARVRVSAGRQR